MKTVQTIVAALGLCLSAAAIAGAPFEATASDTDLQSLMTRWAQNEGKRLVWEAKGNAAIKDADALNANAQLSKAATFAQALERLNRSLDAAHEVNPAKSRPLKACGFSDAIVIRTLDQAPCGSPL